ncbi:MAG: DUF1353 domain-containing protein [Fibromonadaceae bacterium]|jgi:hypothetical protein|nr:DUF1353 domain-containing protein [Fibromonadaceae bacterium]
MIKVNNFWGYQIITEFAGVDLWRLSKAVYVEVITNEGKLCYTMDIGFPTNMRSGSHLIDFLIPKFTQNNLYNLALLCHDFAYTKLPNGENPIPRAEADELLRQMVIMSGVLGRFKAWLMYKVLRLFGQSAYDSENTGEYAGAEELMKFERKPK